MKKILLLLVVLSFVFFSCGKKDDAVTLENGFICEIDGKSWTGDTLTSNILKTGEFTVITSPYQFINSKDLEIFSFVLKGDLKPGDIVLGSESNQSYVEFKSTVTKKDKKFEDDFDAFHSTEGKVKIVKVDENRAEGTFNFTLVTSEEPKKTLKVTKGQFNLKISK